MSASLFGPSSAPPAVRRAVASLWVFRASGELEAAARFRRLSAELARAEASEGVVAMAASAAEDEMRHHGLCAALASSYGLSVEAEPRVAIPVGDTTLSLRDRVLAEVVSLCCISETIATTVLTASMEAARAEDIRDAVHAILKDEVEHSRLGWAHLAGERSLGRGAFLAAWIPRMLEAGIPQDLFDAGAPLEDDAELQEYGCLSKARLRSIFCETLEQVVFPGFEMLGVDPAQARGWLGARS